MPFESPDLNLGELLADVGKGKVQLPDFQREWKWDDDRVKALLASIARDHPVGVLMLLEVDGDQTRFAPKPVAGVDVANAETPELLILDGQQRLTSLFQSLHSGRPVDTCDPRGKKLRRWYYLDIKVALADGADVEEAIQSLPEDRIVRDDFGRNVVADYSSVEKECAEEMFPLSIVYDNAAIFAWQGKYISGDPEHAQARVARWNLFYDGVLKHFIMYKVPAIVLKKDTPKEAVCTVFEKVNTGGVALNVFELLTATFAADNFRLKQDWDSRKNRLKGKPVLRTVESTDFLQSVTLLATRQRRLDYKPTGDGAEKAPGVGCKRKDMLGITREEYLRWADPVTDGLAWASSFLAQEFIFRADDLPYHTQLVPLAAIHAILGAKIDNHAIHGRIRQWFWCGVLGELYGGTTETRFARDVEQVPSWAEGGSTLPNSVFDASFREQRLDTLRTRNSAAYKGIYALLMRGGSLDWMKHQPMSYATFFDYQVDIHHIFPKAWCDKTGVAKVRRESIVNKTAISRPTNISIGGRSPAEYVLTLEAKSGASSAQLDSIFATHLIDPSALRSADFDRFYADRRTKLLDLVGAAMGKEPMRDVEAADVAEDFDEEPEDEPLDADTAEEPAA
jgi:hypothetical protein